MPPPTPLPDRPSYEPEAALWARGYRHVAGVDEAGRGCLAGPVVAAAVILPHATDLPGLDDSKRLTAARRNTLLTGIQEVAVGIGVGICSPAEIDRMNILRAALEAMRRAVVHLSTPADFLLIDGNMPLDAAPCPNQPLVKGDRRSLAIAAASVVAKTTRDRLMHDLHPSFPAYGWDCNVGYPTKAHYAALAEHGPTPHHRRSFRLA